LESDLDGNLDGTITPESAVAMLDSLVLDVSLGYIPPMRPSVLCSIRIPSCSSPCADPDCPEKETCHGNRLEELPGGWSPQEVDKLSGLLMTGEKEPARYSIYIVHHKTSRWSKGQITVIDPPVELSLAISRYLKYARPELLCFRAGSDNLLLTRSGSTLGQSQLCQLWNEIQGHNKVQWTPFSPKKFRHIFCNFQVQEVAEAVANMGAGAAAVQGATIAMGNSVRVMASHYATQSTAQMVQAAVAKIAAWREPAVASIRLQMEADLVGVPLTSPLPYIRPSKGRGGGLSTAAALLVASTGSHRGKSKSLPVTRRQVVLEDSSSSDEGVEGSNGLGGEGLGVGYAAGPGGPRAVAGTCSQRDRYDSLGGEGLGVGSAAAPGGPCAVAGTRSQRDGYDSLGGEGLSVGYEAGPGGPRAVAGTCSQRDGYDSLGSEGLGVGYAAVPGGPRAVAPLCQSYHGPQGISEVVCNAQDADVRSVRVPSTTWKQPLAHSCVLQ
jgi:hypothetical protein